MRIHRGGAVSGAAIMLLLMLESSFAAVNEDESGMLLSVAKVFAAPAPLGKLRGEFTTSQDGKKLALLVECALFRRNVPANGLVDLPRPDWSSFHFAYSLTSYESDKLVARPSLYLVVPLHGPIGKSWEQTWATFHFDAGGKLTRRIKQFIPSASAIRVLWEPWEIGSGVSAEAALDAARRK